MVGYSWSYFNKCDHLSYRICQGSDTGNDKCLLNSILMQYGLSKQNVFKRKRTFIYLIIQIGYEPIPPKPTVTIFGKPALKLPNAFTYGKSSFNFLKSKTYFQVVLNSRLKRFQFILRIIICIISIQNPLYNLQKIVLSFLF